jgi:hypothetical protein
MTTDISHISRTKGNLGEVMGSGVAFVHFSEGYMQIPTRGIQTCVVFQDGQRERGWIFPLDIARLVWKWQLTIFEGRSFAKERRRGDHSAKKEGR